MVVASLVHCCVIKKNVVVASRLYDIADVQFTVEKEDPLELLKFIHKYNLFFHKYKLCSKYSNNAADFPHNCRWCCYL